MRCYTFQLDDSKETQVINIEALRDQPELVRAAMKSRGIRAPVDQILELDATRRSAIAETDTFRSRRNIASKEIGRMSSPPKRLIEEMREIGVRIKKLEAEVRELEEKMSAVLLTLPNIPSAATPTGENEADNRHIRTVGDQRSFDFEIRAHWDIGERLGIIDFERGVRISGSRFYLLRGKGARLQRALIDWMLDVHTEESGYEEVYVPYLVNSAAATGSGQLPKFAETMYKDAEEDFWLIPTAEVPLTNMFAGELMIPADLPKRYTALTSCFRAEAGAAGKDTKGIFRVHQFEKIEQFIFSEPEDSWNQLENIVSNTQEIFRNLELPHRVVLLCTGDLGKISSKTYDVELWFPSHKKYREAASCSNCTDYQSRGLGIKYRNKPHEESKFVHTLNGTLIAVERTLIAIIENYQLENGEIEIPKVLQKYMGNTKIIKNK